jgi:hypothetical protein
MNQPGQLQTITAQQAKEACNRFMFTPGPWRVRFEEIDKGAKHAIEILASDFEDEDFGKEWIANVNQQFTSHENGLANAKLIAAAPEMYDVIAELDSLYKATQFATDLTDVMARAAKIIDKATK